MSTLPNTTDAIAKSEVTGKQSKSDTYGIPGFGMQSYTPPPGDYKTYREMRCNPTVALAFAALTCPIKAAPWPVEVDDDVPDDQTTFIKSEVARMKVPLMTEMVRGIYYGFQSFEKIWGVVDGYMTVERCKPLLPDLTDALVDEHGNLIGLRNKTIELDLDKIVWFTYDGEAGNVYGRSIFENIRVDAYTPWKDGVKKLGAYITKNAGIIPMAHYPVGQSRNRDGVLKDNWEIARDLLNHLVSGSGVIVPTIFPGWGEEALKSGADIDKIMSWRLDFLETRAGAGSEMSESLQHFEALIVRGLLQPEKSLLEGQSGTRAEAAVHTDVALCSSDEMHKLIVKCIQEQIVNPIVEANFGPDQVSKIRLVAGPIASEDKAFYRSVVDKVFTNPTNVDLLLQMLDIDAILDNAEMPKAMEVVDAKTMDEPHPQPDPNAPPEPRSSLGREVERLRVKGGT